jgi:hypothetical protein
VGWGTYIDGRVEHLEDDLRHVPVAQRTTIDYITTWAALRDTRILAELPTISADLSPIWPTDAIQPTAATQPSGWNWWNGDRTERAYSALHRADAGFLALASDELLRPRAGMMLGQLPSTASQLGAVHLASYQTLLTTVAFPKADPPPALTGATRSALIGCSDALDQALGAQHYRVRSYRNLLLATAAGLMALYLLLSIAGALDPAFFSLCAKGASGHTSCPSGHAASPWDVFLLGFAGLVGGSVGALILLLNVKVSGGPFTLPIAQAALKLPAGAVIALVGLFVLQHGSLGVLMPQAGDALVAWALLFGVAQQALTRIIDKRANDLVGGSKATGTADASGSATASPTPPSQ